MRNSSSSKHASVLLLCGLPGSGKSTFARIILDTYKLDKDRDPLDHEEKDAPLDLGFDEILLIDYDKVTDEEYCKTSAESFRSKDERTHFRTYEQSEKWLLSESTIFGSVGRHAWKNSRLRALTILKNALLSHFSNVEYDERVNNKSLLILMDDNFHLRSMRRNVYRACQEILAVIPHAIIGLSTLYIATPLHVCLERNNMRNGKQRIPKDVINRMAETIEPPTISKPSESFDRYHTIIHNFDRNDEMNRIPNIDRSSLRQVRNLINEALQSPLTSIVQTSPEELFQLNQKKSHEQQETLKCRTQRADRLLRKLVGQVVKIEKSKGIDANKARKQILDSLKNEKADSDFMKDETILEEFTCLILASELSDNQNDKNSFLSASLKQVYDDFVSNHNIP